MTYQKTGNPTPADEVRLRILLEKREVGSANTRETIELALLHFSPLYQEPEAISILRDLLTNDPGSELARLWLSYIYVHSEWRFGSTALDSATDILKELITSHDDAMAAAGEIVLYSAMNARNQGSVLMNERISCLQKSIALQPAWVTNHMFLASEFLKAERYAEALGQIRDVRKNQALEPPVIPDPIGMRFERLITGRLSTSAHGLTGRLEAEIFRKCPGLTLPESR